MKYAIQQLVVVWSLLCASFAVAQVITVEEALATRGTAILIRHAIAPGFGDPDAFRIDDCSTQRNLSAEGRAQSKAIGRAFKQAGVSAALVLSSPWCRCMETATLMDIGPVEKFAGLSSFFQDHADQRETMAILVRRLSEQSSDAPPLIMVTHQVVISALTGIGARSGGAVLYHPITNTTQQIAMPKPPYD